jgi:hypothetical protein
MLSLLKVEEKEEVVEIDSPPPDVTIRSILSFRQIKEMQEHFATYPNKEVTENILVKEFQKILLDKCPDSKSLRLIFRQLDPFNKGKGFFFLFFKILFSLQILYSLCHFKINKFFQSAGCL